MQPPTEIRIFVDREKDIYDDIIDTNGVVNIKNLTKKGGKVMLENEKNFELEQLNSLKSKYEKNLEELRAINVDALIDAKVAEKREEIAKDVLTEHENKLSKALFLFEAITEKIAEVEAVEIETPVEELPNDVPADEPQL